MVTNSMESFIKYLCKYNNDSEKLKLKINEDENFDQDDAFLCSCKYNNLSFVKLLVESGCNIHATDRTGENGFMFACGSSERGNLKLVKFLIESGCEIHDTIVFGWSGFLNACSRGNFNLVKYLIESGCNIQQRLNWGENGTGMTLRRGNLKITEFLIESGVFFPNLELLYRDEHGFHLNNLQI
jgi:ankyrin repeat protein